MSNHKKSIHTKNLQEIYEEIKDDFDWVLVNDGEGGWTPMQVKELRNKSFSSDDYYFESEVYNADGPATIYKHINHKKGSKVWGFPLKVEQIIRQYLEDNYFPFVN